MSQKKSPQQKHQTKPKNHNEAKEKRKEKRRRSSRRKILHHPSPKSLDSSTEKTCSTRYGTDQNLRYKTHENNMKVTEEEEEEELPQLIINGEVNEKVGAEASKSHHAK